MKMFLLISIAACTILLTSCGGDIKPNEQGEYIIKAGKSGYEVRVKLFGNGKIESVQQVKNDTANGFFANFYEDGTVKNTGTSKDGKKESAGIVFYPDGSVNTVGEYKNDKQNGYFWMFTRKKELLEKREYRIIDGKSRINQWVRMNPMMQVVPEESSFVFLRSAKDTIRKGDTYELSISLDASAHKKYMAVIIGPFDEEFKLPPNSKCDTLVAKNFTATYTTSKYEVGENIIRGIVQDISVSADKSGSSARNIYFSREFLVRK
jgi:hypothetical protein